MDPNFQGPLFCAMHEQRVENKGDARGCLILNHDTPSLLNKRSDYNTTGDVLRLIQEYHLRAKSSCSKHVMQRIKLYEKFDRCTRVCY